MENSGSFVAEVFSGINAGHVKVVPAADGSQLGISFLPEEGEPLSVILSQSHLEEIVLQIAKGAQLCQERAVPTERVHRLRG